MKTKIFLLLFLIGCNKFDHDCVQLGMTKEELVKSCGMYTHRTFNGATEYLRYPSPHFVGFPIQVELLQGKVIRLGY